MTDDELETIRADISNCATYNFGMRAADRLAHEGAPALLAEVFRLRALVGEPEWEYARVYFDEAGYLHHSKVSVADAVEHAPDGHRADGSPYWNYELVRRPKAGPWVPVPETGDDR